MVIHHLPQYIQSHILFFHFFLHQVALVYLCQLVLFIPATILFQWIQSLLPSTWHLCTKLGVKCWMSGNCCHLALNKSHSWKLYMATLGSCLLLFCTCALPNMSPVVCCLAYLLSRLPKLPCTFLQNHPNPLPPNPFGIIEVFQWQPALKSPHNVCNWHLPVQGSMSQLFQTVLSPDSGPMLLFQKPSNPYFFPHVEGTKVGLSHHCAKLLQGEFRLVQADWGFFFGPAHDWWIVNLTICIIFVMGYIG